MSVQRPPEWEPEPLRLPVEQPVRRAPPQVQVELDIEPDEASRAGDRQGSHVIVIDIA